MELKKCHRRLSFYISKKPLLSLSGMIILALLTNFQASAGSYANIKSSHAAVKQELLTVKGIVLDDKDGEPIIGASITDPQKKTLGVTGVNGDFTIRVPKGTQITFSSIGYTSASRTINENQNNLNIRLKSSSTALDEVVVTALGIKREEKALGYSITTVKGEELTEALSNNWMDALSGKVAGLNMVKSGGGPAGSNKIILRGETSLSGNNAALIVVDGVVISGSSGQLTGTGSGSYQSADSPVDFGSSLADLNPEDIESVSVLKGAGAAALYGSRGSNGAIIITTKQGNGNKKGIGVSFNSNSAFATINRWPDYQYEYGQGNTGQDLYYSYGATVDGPSTYSTSSAWGPKFNGQMFFQYSPENYRQPGTVRTPWVAYPNNRKDFFETAKTFTNSLSIYGGNKTTTARLSITNANNSWIVPNTGYDRNTVALQLNHKVTDKLSISSKINYNNRTSDNLPTTGYNNQTIMYFIRGITPNMDINWFKDYWLPGQEEVGQRLPFSTLLDNPYLQAYEMLNASKRNGVIGNVQATYNFTDQWSLMARTSMDLMYESRSQRRPKNTQRFQDGMYREQDIYTQEQNSDFLLSYKNDKGKLIKYSGSFGGSHMLNSYRRDEYRADKLLYPGYYNFANAKELVQALPYRSSYSVNSLYYLAAASYNDFLYFDITGRLDWASTLTSSARKDKPFFYDSYNLSAVLTDVLKLPKEITFLKVRGSVASVGGGGTTPYLTSYSYTSRTNFPSGLGNPTAIPDEHLSFERTRSYEAGVDARFFKNRLGLDVAVYHSNSFDQILRSPIDPASGYANLVLNAGNVRNRGIEIAANGTPIDVKKVFTWKTNATFSANRNKVLSLADSMENMVLSTVFGSRGTVEARPGGRYGDMYGLGYQRSPDGQIVYNENGYPLQGDSIKYLGNATPKWRFGFGNQFTYKQFSLNVLFDGQFGGKAYSLTHAVLMEEGKLKKTLPGRYNGIIGNGVIQNPDGTYRKNDVVAGNIRDYYYLHFNRDNLESNMFRTDFIKFREARFDYTLPAKVTSRLKMQRAVIGVYGRDLLVFSKWPAFDPEFGTLGNGDIETGAEVAQFPSTRTFGVNLTVGF